MRGSTNGTIRLLYAELIGLKQDNLAKHENKWVERVGATPEALVESLELARMVLCSAGLQAQNFKTVFALYYTLARLAQWGGLSGITCPQCGAMAADLVHMFGSCPRLPGLLESIMEFLDRSLGLKITLTSDLVLLGLSRTEQNEMAYQFLFVAMAVLRMNIASAWLDPSSPTFHQWLAQFSL